VMMRVKLTKSTSFSDILNDVKQSFLNIMEHKNIPFEYLVEKLNVKNDASRSSLFQLMFSYVSASESIIKFDKLETSEYLIDHFDSSKFDLQLSIVQDDKSLEIFFQYDTDLYRLETIHTIANNYISLLESIINDGDQPLLNYNILEIKEKEIYQKERCLNKVMPLDCTKERIINYVHKLFESSVEKYPDNIAVTYKDMAISYKQLNERSNELAHFIIENTSIQNIVGISLDRSIDLIIAIVAVLKSGCAYLPLDPYYPTDRLEYMLDDSKASVVITSKNYTEKYSSFTGKVIVLDEFKEISNKYSNNNPQVDLKPEFLQNIIYTSGSTGKPKGVMVNHSNVFHFFYNVESVFDFNSNDAWTLFHSYSFDFSVHEIWGALIFGAKLVVVPYLVSRNPEELYNLLIKENVTVLSLITSALLQLILYETNSIVNTDKNVYNGLRYIFFGGEKVLMESLEPWLMNHPNNPKLMNIYGPTETTIFSTYQHVEKDILLRKKTLIGYPTPNSKIYILDKNMQHVPNNVVGEICIGGEGVTNGYLNREQLTNEKFLKPSFDPKNRIYKSGDLGRFLYDGLIEYLGRIDHQVKINGFRIELGEIESAIFSTQMVEDDIVVPYGLVGNQRLVAYIVLKDNHVPIDENEREKVTKILFKKIKEFLPKFMLPSSYMYLENFKRNDNRKIDRNALPEPNYFYFDKDEDRIIVSPKTELEITVVSLLSKLLKLNVEDISMTDNVFNLGINSILVIQFAHEINNNFKMIKISIRNVYENPTIMKLCDTIQSIQMKAINEGKNFFFAKRL
jgi:amino acid adenylation domain-containing protein